jgi:AhpD family alkylhydroperoxidase
MRVDYRRVAPEGIAALGKASGALLRIEPRLRALVELRVSQINGCAFCLDLHAREARKHGESQQRLDCLAAWHESALFDAREGAALAWAEALTRVETTHAADAWFEPLRAVFSEEEIVELTHVVAVINAFNRIAIGLRNAPPPREPGK